MKKSSLFVSIYLFLLFFMFNFSCNNNDKLLNKKFVEYIKEVTQNDMNKDNYLIVSNSSCKSCVDKIIAIVRDSKQVKVSTLILIDFQKTDIENIKTILPLCKIISDKKRIFYNIKNEEIITYDPVFIKIKKNEVLNKFIFSSEQTVSNLSKLNTLLNKE